MLVVTNLDLWINFALVLSLFCCSVGTCETFLTGLAAAEEQVCAFSSPPSPSPALHGWCFQTFQKLDRDQLQLCLRTSSKAVTTSASKLTPTIPVCLFAAASLFWFFLLP